MKRILIVDSDPKVCQAIQKALSVKACTVFFAFDAVAAVSEARKHNPDLLIVDLSLPAGSGLVVVERLRALPAFARMPIIMIAERGARLETERVFDAGANAFLPKPLHSQLLLSYVGRLLPREPMQSAGLEAVQSL
jgi:two-component system, OmpR family, alkaline phosphatase synthesis response regulator PhoP